MLRWRDRKREREKARERETKRERERDGVVFRGSPDRVDISKGIDFNVLQCVHGQTSMGRVPARKSKGEQLNRAWTLCLWKDSSC